MKIIKTKANELEKTFSLFVDKLKGNFTSILNEYNFSFENEIGEGQIRGISLLDNITYFEYNVTFKEDVIINNNITDQNPIYFLYPSKGTLLYNANKNNPKQTLKPYQTLIYSANSSSETELYFKKEVHYKICVVEVNKISKEISKSRSNSINKKIRETFCEKYKENTFVYAGSYNLKIAELIEKLYQIKETGIVEALLIQGIVTTILALEIQQYLSDLANTSNDLGSLNIRELQVVKKLSDCIRNNPEHPYCIESLCKEGGITPSKLQEGFRILHDRTVSDFIRNERLKMAEILIRSKNITVSEVVYSIGLTSRSYFSKIFKKKYKCSPKYYQDNHSRLLKIA